MNHLLVVACGLGFGLGIVGIVWSWGDAAHPPGPLASRLSVQRLHRSDLPLLIVAAVGAAVAGTVTRWPVAVPITALAVYGIPTLFGRTSTSVSIVRIEAIATWTEMLQSTLAASAGLGQAIVSTAPLSPPPIRAATVQLASRLTTGMHPQEALLLFADELEDSCADRVICALQLAVSARVQRLGELLSALAESTRDEVALRLRIETSRASIRSSVRTVVVFSVVFSVALTLLARTYLQPFDTAQGQLVLLTIGSLYAVGLSLMVTLARPPAPVRLLGSQVIRR